MGDGSRPQTFRDPDVRTRSAGSFTRQREAEQAGHRAEHDVADGAWHDPGLIGLDDLIRVTHLHASLF